MHKLNFGGTELTIGTIYDPLKYIHKAYARSIYDGLVYIIYMMKDDDNDSRFFFKCGECYYMSGLDQSHIDSIDLLLSEDIYVMKTNKSFMEIMLS